MEVISNYERLEWLLDVVLLPRWRSTPKGYPFNHPNAVIPQTLIPDELRRDKNVLSNWYLYVDEHMKGRVESMEAFRGHLRIFKKYPWFYHPRELIYRKHSEIIEVLEDCIPTDKVNVARDLKINALQLHTYYDGLASNILKGVTNYDEATRRLLNKRTKSERLAAGFAGEGFYGHQEKMVSMFVYWWDWEDLLNPRFPYPSPSDIQNIRCGIGAQVLVTKGYLGTSNRNRGVLAAAWRKLVMRYVVEHKAGPREVSDVFWLFGNRMCGNSPLTQTPKDEGVNGSGMFDMEDLPHVDGVRKFLHPRYCGALERTCLICPLLKTCNHVIPARLYYSKGKIELRPRPKVEDRLDLSHLREPEYWAEEPNLAFPFDSPE